MNRSIVGGALCVLAGVGLGFGQLSCTAKSPDPAPESPARASKPALESRSKLPTPVRSALARRMARHGDDMTNLHWSVVTLDPKAVEGFARALAEEPTFSRPREGDQNLINAQIPEAFFDQQAQLVRGAEVLQKAAASGDRAAMTSAYTSLFEVCVACHAQYLEGVSDKAP